MYSVATVAAVLQYVATVAAVCTVLLVLLQYCSMLLVLLQYCSMLLLLLQYVQCYSCVATVVADKGPHNDYGFAHKADHIAVIITTFLLTILTIILCGLLTLGYILILFPNTLV